MTTTLRLVLRPVDAHSRTWSRKGVGVNWLLRTVPSQQWPEVNMSSIAHESIAGELERDGARANTGPPPSRAW